MHGQYALPHRSDAAVVYPAAYRAKVRREAAVLVHHQADAARDAGGKSLGFAERRRERLLAQHVNAMRGGELREFDMRLAPRRDVHRVGLFACKHRRGISINTGNRERRGARASLRHAER